MYVYDLSVTFHKLVIQILKISTDYKDCSVRRNADRHTDAAILLYYRNGRAADGDVQLGRRR